MATPECPEFLKPRLRLFLSADIIGSTALKQSRLGALGSANPSAEASWFTIIQGFYFEAQQNFLSEWEALRVLHPAPEHFGDAPELWKTIGDEVLFTKSVTDHRQVAVTIQCWVRALDRMRDFLTRDSSRLGVKSTAWIAGFPFRNKEVVLRGGVFSKDGVIEDYYKENGNILNQYYSDKRGSDILIDYVGPSIDTGFRLSSLATDRKMIFSLEIAYILSLTSTTKAGPIEEIQLHYDGQIFLKGVLNGISYPTFWLDLSKEDSAAAKEDRLTGSLVCDRDAIRQFCDAFYQEHGDLVFPPFIHSESEPILIDRPPWYEKKHQNLIKNFYESSVFTPEPEEPDELPDDANQRDTLERLKLRLAEISKRVEEREE